MLVPSRAETQPLHCSDPESQSLCLPGFQRRSTLTTFCKGRGVAGKWARKAESFSSPSSLFLKGPCSRNSPGKTGCPESGEREPVAGRCARGGCLDTHPKAVGEVRDTKLGTKRKISGLRKKGPRAGRHTFRGTDEQFEGVATLRNSRRDLRDTGKGVLGLRWLQGGMGTAERRKP